MAPTELVTAAQERLDITIVVSENHGYQVIHRLQMNRSGREFGNEFRYRTDGDIMDGRPPSARLRAWTVASWTWTYARSQKGWARKRSAPPPRPRCARRWPIPAILAVRWSWWCRRCRTSTCPAGMCGGTSLPPRYPGRRWVQALRAEYEQARGAQRWFG